MSQSTFDRVCQQILEADHSVLWQIAAMCDGHGILDPRKLIESGLPESVVDYFTETLKSDGTHKGTLYVNGQPVEELKGVYGLRLLEAFAAIFELDYPPCIGRGFKARAIQQALRDHLNPVEQEEPPPAWHPRN